MAKQKSIKNIRQEFKDSGVFYTPPEMAEELKKYVTFKPKRVYDPTCGAGNLLAVFDDDAEKYGQEIDGEQLNSIDIPNFHGYSGDTLKDDGFKGMKFDLIMANPPFSIKWNPDELKDDERFTVAPAMAPPSKADWAFMLHILNHMDEAGTAIVLMFPGILYRGQKEGKIRQWFVENNYIEKIVAIESGRFEDTSIATVLIVMRKGRVETDITFENDGVIKTVSRKEVEKENYNLSPSTYAFREIEKEKIDPIHLESVARCRFVERFRKELEFELMVCDMEKISIDPFLDELQKVLDFYKTNKGGK